MNVCFQFDTKRLTIGGLLIAIGRGIDSAGPYYFPEYDHIGHDIGLVLFVLGIFITITGLITYNSGARIYPSWRSDLICKTIRSADANSTISLLQTSFPNANELLPLLQHLLVDGGKAFKLRILVANPHSDDGWAIVKARVYLRDQEASHHAGEIVDQLGPFKSLKIKVDKAWQQHRNGAKLDLQIRVYEHLPFGPQYHIGEKQSFIGFFICDKSSINAPMLRVGPNSHEIWNVFRHDFEAAWDGAAAYFPETSTGSS